MAHRWPAAALLAIALTAVSAAAAQARPVASVSGSTLTITGDGAPADLTIEQRQGGVEVIGAAPGQGCVASAAGASCPTTDSTVLDARLSGAPETLRGVARFAGATVDGAGGDDTLIWRAASSATLLGGTGADRLIAIGGGTGPVTLEGQDGNDRLDIGRRTGSSETVTGGANTDRVSYADRTETALTLSLDGTRNDGALGENDQLGSGIENVVGGSRDDRITGNALANTIDGGLGADTIDGAGRRDTLSYALGSGRTIGIEANLNSGRFPEGDSVSAMEDLSGTNFADSLIGSQTGEVLNGLGGDDTLFWLGGADTLIGGDGDDLASFRSAPNGLVIDLNGGSPDGTVFQGIERVRGTLFDDRLIGGPAGDVLDGELGDDELLGGPGTDTFTGGGGRDVVSYDDGPRAGVVVRRTPDPGNADGGEVVPADVEVIRGSPVRDVIFGGEQAERIEAGGGDDFIQPALGADEIDGGPGEHDELSLFGGGAAVVRLLAARRGFEVNDGDTWEGIEDLQGSAGADTVDASDDGAPNILSFGTGDTVSYARRTDGVDVSPGGIANDGGLGEDDDVSAEIIEGTQGPDTFIDLEAAQVPNRYIGGDGNDFFAATDAFVPENTPRDVFDGGPQSDTVLWSSLQPVRLSLIDRRGSYNDELLGIEDLIGGPRDDSLVGDDADNEIEGGGGNDVISGLGGQDEFTDAFGADVYSGGAGSDSMFYDRSREGVTVTTDGQPDDGAPGAGDNVDADIEELFGSTFDDRLVALGATVHLVGSSGNDTLVAPAGGAPEEIVEGQSGTDTLDMSRRNAPDGVVLTAGARAQVGTLSISGFENLVGSSGPDTLTGDAGPNELRGGPGDDRLDGGPGADLVLGGAGADAFTDADGEPDRLGGSLLLFGTGGLDAEQAQADRTAAGSAVSISKFIRDDRLLVRSLDPARRVVVDLAAHETDLGDVVRDIETVTGTDGPDRLVGDTAENTLNGGGGDDEIAGGGQNDRLNGGDGADQLTDRSAERDIAVGGAGADVLDTVDLNPPTVGDSLDCGADDDVFSSDLFDQVDGTCERAFNAPIREHPLTRVRIVGERVGPRGRVGVLLFCPQRGPRRICRGVVSIEQGVRRRTTPRVLAARRYHLRAGRGVQLALRLRRPARRRLARRGQLGVRVAARELDTQDRPRESSAPVVLRRRLG